MVRQSERHLDKITNVDEFVKRVFSVIHSNDPIARALTLRTLGAVASIIPERRQAHHNIRGALDSQDAIELRAAIYAASRFAARSKSFAVNMCEKISDMIKGCVIFEKLFFKKHNCREINVICFFAFLGMPLRQK